MATAAVTVAMAAAVTIDILAVVTAVMATAMIAVIAAAVTAAMLNGLCPVSPSWPDTYTAFINYEYVLLQQTMRALHSSAFCCSRQIVHRGLFNSCLWVTASIRTLSYRQSTHKYDIVSNHRAPYCFPNLATCLNKDQLGIFMYQLG